jgi:hypothetical protein
VRLDYFRLSLDSKLTPKPSHYSNRLPGDQRLAPADGTRDNPGRQTIAMPSAANLFRLLSELIVLLLGGLLILISLTGTVGLPAYPAALVVVGVVLIYWGIRAWMRPGQASDRWPTRIRAGSLVLVGVLVLGIRILPLRDTVALVVLAGSVLVVRGIAGMALLVRRT